MLTVSFDELMKEDIEKYLFQGSPGELIMRFAIDIKHAVIILGAIKEDHILIGLEHLANEHLSYNEDLEAARLFADHIVGCSAFFDSSWKSASVIISESSIEKFVKRFKINHSQDSLNMTENLVQSVLGKFFNTVTSKVLKT